MTRILTISGPATQSGLLRQTGLGAATAGGQALVLTERPDPENPVQQFLVGEAILAHPGHAIVAQGAVVPLVAAVLAQWPHLAQTRVLLVDPVIAPGQSCDRLPRAATVQIVVGRKADAPRRAMARHLAAELGCALRDQRPLASFGQIQAERAQMIAATVMRLCRWRAYARAPQAGPV